MKLKLNTLPKNGGPFNCRPADIFEIEDSDIRANDVTLPWEFNPHSVRLFVIGNEFGALGAVWGEEHEILNIAADLGMLDSCAIDEKEIEFVKDEAGEIVNELHDDCEFSRLGNASEPFDLGHVWLAQVRLDPAQDCRLLCAFAEARGDAAETLYR